MSMFGTKQSMFGTKHYVWYKKRANNVCCILEISINKCCNWRNMFKIHHCRQQLGQNKLEWGCPNGTKYPPRQPIPNRAILPNRERVYRWTDRRTDRVIPVYPPPNFVVGGIKKLFVSCYLTDPV